MATWAISILVLLPNLVLGVDESQYGWVTPLRGNISPECRRDSLAYATALASGIGNETWALQMFDSNGRFPMEGFLTDTITQTLDVCTLAKNWTGCTDLPMSARQISISIPIGYSRNPGSFDGCLSSATATFTGKYCPLKILGPPGTEQETTGPEGRQVNSKNDLLLPPTMHHLVANLPNKTNQDQIVSESQSFLFTDAEKITKYIENVYNMFEKSENSFILLPKTHTIYLMMMTIYSTINTPRIGLCVPSTCSVADVLENYDNLTKELNYMEMVPLPTFQLLECYSEENKSGTPEELPGWNIFFYLVFAIIGVLMIIGTIVEVWNINMRPNNTRTPSLLMKSLLCFSVYGNLSRLMTTESVGTDHLDCMNGMRFLSMSWVVLGHTFMAVTYDFVGIRNLLESANLFLGGGGLSFEAVGNGLVSVDSFFLMSGALTAYIMFKELDSAGSNMMKHSVTFVMFYVHRYIRLTITYALIMGVVIAILPYTYYGPGWFAINFEAEMCRQNGWSNLLYINSLLSDEYKVCMPVTWYLVCDMIFHWFAPVVLYPMFFACRKMGNHAVACLWWLLVMIIFTAVVFSISVVHKLPPTVTHSLALQDLGTDYDYQVSFYQAPWLRFQPYLIGILLGYILHHTRGKAVKINANLNIILWQVSMLAVFAVVFGGYESRSTGTITLFATTMYNTFQRIAWGLSLSWIIFSSVKGYGGVINDFLSWSVFSPLSRLTYCCYLVHLNIINMFAYSTLSSYPHDFSMWIFVWYFFGNLSIALSVALVLALCFESPFIRLEKLWIGKLLQTLAGKPRRNGAQNNNRNHANIVKEKPASRANGVEEAPTIMETGKVLVDKKEIGDFVIYQKPGSSTENIIIAEPQPPSYDDLEKK